MKPNIQLTECASVWSEYGRDGWTWRDQPWTPVSAAGAPRSPQSWGPARNPASSASRPALRSSPDDEAMHYLNTKDQCNRNSCIYTVKVEVFTSVGNFAQHNFNLTRGCQKLIILINSIVYI